MSWILKDTFDGRFSAGGKAEEEMSKPVSRHVDGRVLATSRSQAPVPGPMSAILRVGEMAGMLGWMRKPRVLVVMMCCSSSLFERLF